MAIQPRWNKYEAAILFQAVENVENGLEKRKDAIVRVSKTLRKMAESQDIIFDEIYRNVNGITFQFQSMECSAYGRITPTKKAGSKLFDELVQLKRDFPQEYTLLLEQAKMMTDGNITPSGKEMDNGMEYRNMFRAWLMDTGKKEAVANRIVEGFDKVSSYARDKKISARTIWEISDLKQYRDFVHSLQEYKLFRVLQKDSYRFLQNNAKLYLTFLKNEASMSLNNPLNIVSEEDYLRTDTDRKLNNLYPLEFKKVYSALKQDNKYAYLTVEQILLITKSSKEIVEHILGMSSWSDKLGNGYVLGKNRNHHSTHRVKLYVGSVYEIDTKLETIMKTSFRRGFCPHSIMDRKRFINIYEEKYDERLSDEEVVSQITKVCFLFDRRLFLPKAILDKDISELILHYVENYFEQREILFYDVLFEHFKESFNSFIYSPDMLAAYMKYTFEGTTLYYSDKYFSYNYDAKPDITREVEEYLIRADKPCTYDEIYSGLSHLKRKDIYSVLHHNSPEILGNSKTEYFHVEVAHINPREITVLETCCSKLLEGSKYITCNEIIDNLEQLDSELYERCTDKFSVLGIRRIFTYYLRSNFDVVTGVIARRGAQMTIADVFADYARNHTHFSVDAVQELAKYTGTVPYWGAVCSNAIRINKTEFVADNMVEFDVESIDSTIAYYCGEYIPLYRIADFNRFPSCGYPWNTYLLQQYVYRFSKSFELLFLGFTKNNASGVIVKKQQGYPNFESVVVDVLAKTTIATKDEALDYLCNEGFITERRYKRVEELIKKAAVLRKKNYEK